MDYIGWNGEYAPMQTPSRKIDDLVLGTTNAPYRRSIGAGELAACLSTGESGSWLVHVATFFTDVRPKLILEFADQHGIAQTVLASTYAAIKLATGETSRDLEVEFEQLVASAGSHDTRSGDSSRAR